MDLLLKTAKICRICGNESNFIDLSHPDSQSYVDKFLSCANVTFEIDDKFPKFMCQLCNNDLENSYRFKKKCEQSHQKYQQIITIATSHLKIETNENELNDKITTDIDDNNFNENIKTGCGSNSQMNDIIQEDNYDKVIDIKIETNCQEEMADTFLENNYDNDDLNLYFENVPKTNTKQIDRNAIFIKKTKFICDICNRKYETKLVLEVHMRKNHNMAKNLCECKYCGIFISGRDFTQHICCDEKPFKCESCSFSCTTYEHLTRHILNMHQIPKKPVKILKKNNDSVENMNMLKTYKCDYCQKIFMDENELKQHESVKEFDFQCDKCCKSFKNKYTLQSHINLIHSTSVEKELNKLKQIERKNIRIAKKETNQSSSEMARKQKKKHLVRICQICGKVCTTSNNFFYHMTTHNADNDTKSYKCEYCGKLFKRNTHLRLHERTHTGEKPYKCNTCDMTFRQSPHLIRHTRTHTGDKPFNCDICTKTFAQVGNLIKHKRIHTGDKPFKCELCEENFMEANILKKHVLNHHNQ